MILSDSEVTFIGEGENAALVYFSSVFFYI